MSLLRRPLLALPFAMAAPAARAAFAPDSAPDRPLAEIALSRGITYGCAVTGRLIAEEPDFAGLVAREAAAVVPEYEAKFGALKPEEGRFTFDRLDAVITWAGHFRKSVRGHALVWHQDLPDWTRAAPRRCWRRISTASSPTPAAVSVTGTW